MPLGHSGVSVRSGADRSVERPRPHNGERESRAGTLGMAQRDVSRIPEHRRAACGVWLRGAGCGVRGAAEKSSDTMTSLCRPDRQRRGAMGCTTPQEGTMCPLHLS